jgi:NSS family neurotransmitter:Na+ symporter
MYLFTPDPSGIAQPDVWKGAFSQMFFSLSLGLGTMTAYASYLPKNADQVNNSLMVSFLNCGFEYIAGIAIFSMLFAFALNPVGGTLSLSFFAIPQGISAFPFAVKLFGFSFFLLLVMAGVTSAISLVEGMASAIIDKTGVSRATALAMVAVPGIIGSLITALPFVVDPELGGNGTVGLNFLDILDHWAFGYSLLTVGLLECVMIGWVFGADKLRAFVNEHTRLKLGLWFEWLVKLVIPTILFVVIVWNLYVDLTGTLYGSANPLGPVDWFPVVIPLVWIFGTLGLSAYLVTRPTAPEPAEPAVAQFER